MLEIVAWGTHRDPQANVWMLVSAFACFWGDFVTWWMATIVEELRGLRKSFDTPGQSMNSVAKWLKQILSEVAEPPAKAKPRVRTCVECSCPLGRDEAVCPNCRTDQRPDLQRADDEAMEFLNVS